MENEDVVGAATTCAPTTSEWAIILLLIKILYQKFDSIFLYKLSSSIDFILFVVLWIWYNKYWLCLNCEYICYCRSSVVVDVIPYLCYLFLPFSLPPYLTLAYLQQFVRFSPFLWSHVKFDITQTFARRVVPEVHAQFTKSTTTVLTKNYTFLISWYDFIAVQKETIRWIYWMWDDTSCISCETVKSHNVAGLSFLSQWSFITKTKLIEFYLLVMKTKSCHQSWLATWLLSH